MPSEMINLIFALLYAALFGGFAALFMCREKGEGLDLAMHALFSLLMVVTLVAGVMGKIL